MNAPWHSEFATNPGLVRRVISSQFPSLGDPDVRVLREGWESTAFLVDNRFVFRFPKRADVEPMLMRELRLLPELRTILPLEIPDFQFIGEPSALFPWMFVGYPLIAGVQAVDVEFGSVPRERVARQLGAFFRKLHTFDLARAEKLLQTSRCGWRDFPLLRKRVMDALPTLERHGQDTRRIRTFFDDDTLFEDAKRARLHLVHNDFSAQHIILHARHERVIGVIDFGDVDVGDAAVDFAGLYHWGGRAFTEEVLAHDGFSVDSTFVERARWVAACLGVYGLQFGLKSSRPEEVRAGLRALALAFDA